MKKSQNFINRYRDFFQNFYWPFIIPSTITFAAICLGLTAVRTVSINGDYGLAIILIFSAALLDNLDGWTARKLQAQSPIGAQLDSLADFVNFAIAPSFIMYQFILHQLGLWGWGATLFFIIAGAFRLARFNSMQGKLASKWKYYFQGVPTPAAAFLCFVPLIIYLINPDNFDLPASWVAGWLVFVAVLMVSGLPTYSSKGIKINSTKQQLIVIALLFAIAYGVAIYQWLMVIILIAVYFLSFFVSPIHFARKKNK